MALQTLDFPIPKMNSITSNSQSFYPINSNYCESKINIPYHQNSTKAFTTTTSTTSALLSSLTSQIEEEVTNKILHKLNLKTDNTNNILMVTMCNLIDEITHTFKNDMKNMSKENIKSSKALQFDHKQVFNNNKIMFSKILNKFKNYENNQQLLLEKVNYVQQQQNQMVIINKQHQKNLMINQMSCMSDMLDDKSNLILTELYNHQEQLLQEIKNIKFNNNNQLKLVNKNLKNLKKESNILSSNLKHQLKQLNKVNTTSTTLLDNIKCFKNNILTNEKKLDGKNKKQTFIKYNIRNNIKNVKSKQSKVKNTKTNDKNKKVLKNKTLSNENTKVKQNFDLKEVLSKVNNDLKKINDKIDDYNISHKKIIISQNVMMSNIKKVKQNIDVIANKNFNGFTKSLVNNIQNKFEQLIIYGSDNYDENIESTIGVIDDYNKLHNTTCKIVQERDMLFEKLHGIQNIIKKNETISKELKKEVFNCLYPNHYDLTLISNDFIQVKSNKSIIKLSELLEILYKGDEKINTLYVPNLSGDILIILHDYMIYKYMNQNIKDVKDMIEWEKMFIRRIYEQNNLDAVIYATEYLGIESLKQSIKNFVSYLNGNEVCIGTFSN